MRAFGHTIKCGSRAHRSPSPPFLPSAMSLDEHQPVRSLSGTTSVWSHSSVDKSSGASTPVVTAFSTLRRPSGSATMSNATSNGNGNLNGAQHHPPHTYVHRQAQSQAQHTPATSQNQTAIPVATTADIRNGNIAFSDGSRGSQPALLRAQAVRKFGPAAIPIVRPSPASQAIVGAIGDGRKRAVLGVSLTFSFLLSLRCFCSTAPGSKSCFLLSGMLLGVCTRRDAILRVKAVYLSDFFELLCIRHHFFVDSVPPATLGWFSHSVPCFFFAFISV
jgi:hypothetical protein